MDNDLINKKNNEELIHKYPFLMPKNVFSGKTIDDFDYSWTELDAMPKGWKIRFSKELCEDIKHQLIIDGNLDEYAIMQIKEKFGELRWYDNGSSRNVHDIITKYSYISRHICIECGKNAKLVNISDWLEPYCDDCLKKVITRYNKYNSHVDIKIVEDNINTSEIKTTRYSNHEPMTKILDCKDILQRINYYK